MFVAIELEWELKRALRSVIDALAAFHREVRWVKEPQMHLTLKFLGDVPDENVPRVCDACRRAADASAAFTLSVDRCGCFPPRGQVRVIWAGMNEPPAELLDCAAACERELGALGFAPERRPFTAHMTVGRVRDDHSAGRLREAVDAVVVRPAAQQVTSLTVFQSVLRPQGAEHTALGRFNLGGGS